PTPIACGLGLGGSGELGGLVAGSGAVVCAPSEATAVSASMNPTKRRTLVSLLVRPPVAATCSSGRPRRRSACHTFRPGGRQRGEPSRTVFATSKPALQPRVRAGEAHAG